jgi:predicted acetyltransferase
MALTIRYSTWDDFPYVKTINARAENTHRSLSDSIYEAHKFVFPPDRNIMAFDGKNIVGNALSYSMDMYIPGGISKIAAVASVSVQATHRRQGINRQIMKFQLENIHEREEPIAVLQASESIIYGRYGYGMSSFDAQLKIDRMHSSFATENSNRGDLSFIEDPEARIIFPEVYERAIMNRTGMVTRSTNWWNFRFINPIMDGSITNYWNVKFIENDTCEGYVRYTISGTELEIIELIANTENAYSSLWEFCLNMDLVTSIKAPRRPIDDELKWMLADPRRLRETLSDRYWIRIVDLCAAMQNRTYSIDGSIVIKIRDEFLPWNNGTIQITSESGTSTCKFVNLNADLEMTTADLASTYINGINFSVLQNAKRVLEITPGSILKANQMFATDRAPWCMDGW